MAVLTLVSAAPVHAQTRVEGRVTAEGAPLADAIVCGIDWDVRGRIAWPESCVPTDDDGAFSVETVLTSVEGAQMGQITAAAVDHLTTDLWVDEDETTGVEIALDALDEPDNPDYAWWPPAGTKPEGCGSCHGSIVYQWDDSWHARATDDPWVLQMYDGTDANGNPGVGPGYRLDHDDAGECGACHAATASWEAGESVAMDAVPPEHRVGVACETCHKIRSVNPGAAPGTLGSIEMWRPSYLSPAGTYVQFCFGPYPNSLSESMYSSYSPLQRRAELCGGCHEYVNPNGVAVLDTYSDWLEVGDPEQTEPCQGCHMSDPFEIGPEHGIFPTEWIVDDANMRATAAQRRDPEDVRHHRFFGGAEYAPHALQMEVEVEQEGTELVVRTVTTNVGANHRVPTGMPFREMILVVVTSWGETGDPLELSEGPVVAARGGDRAGQPGVLFAKSLGDASGLLTFAFWDATQTLDDNRLAPGMRDESEFRFALPGAGTVGIDVQLLYRRASQPLADAKGWEVDDQEVGHHRETIEVTDPSEQPDGGPEPDVRDGWACQLGAPGRPTAAGVAGGWLAAVVLAWVWARRRRGDG